MNRQRQISDDVTVTHYDTGLWTIDSSTTDAEGAVDLNEDEMTGLIRFVAAEREIGR